LFQFEEENAESKMNEVPLAFLLQYVTHDRKKEGKPCCYCLVLTENHGQKSAMWWYKYGCGSMDGWLQSTFTFQILGKLVWPLVLLLVRLLIRFTNDRKNDA
jgi:hypothetical protein